MAGMDWFRWHHGSVTDPKFQLVAKKAGASVAEVIAVWATLLEAASQSEVRGTVGEVDFESMDCALGLDDGKSYAIHQRMTERGLIEYGQMSAWERRQPKREREDNTNASRQAAFKAKKNQVTPDNASDDQKTPRGEERRVEEINTPSNEGVARTPGEACKAMKSAGMASVNPSNPKLIALLEAGISIAELADAASDAAAKGKPFAYALATAEGRRRDSVTAALPDAQAKGSETVYQRSMRLRMAEFAPDIARKAPGEISKPTDFFETVEAQTLRIE